MAWARDSVNLAQAEAYADAGVFLALKDILSSEHGKLSLVTEEPQNIKFQDHTIAVLVHSESGKLDVNYAPIELLTNLFLTAGESESDVSKSVHAIEDRRSTASETELTSNTEQNDIRMKNREIQSLAEFNQICQLPNSIFKKIRPALTIFSQKSTIRTLWAPLEVLRILPEMDDKKVATIRAIRKTDSQNMANLSKLYARKELNGEVLSILATVRVGECVFTRRAVIRLTGQSERPYLVLDWGQAEDG